MYTVPLNIHGGGTLEVHGSLDARKLLIILSRENFRQDELLVARLAEFFIRKNFTVARYESAAVAIARSSNPRWLDRLPRTIRFIAKALVLAAHPRYWRHYATNQPARHNTIDYRTQALRELVALLGADKEIVFLTRSASGRAASLIADQAGIYKLVCLGYPFQNPKIGVEPERYLHLESIATPFLIIQGTRDPYGGSEIIEKYKFSRSTTIRWVETDHNFVLSDREWERILGLVHDFIEAA